MCFNFFCFEVVGITGQALLVRAIQGKQGTIICAWYGTALVLAVVTFGTDLAQTPPTEVLCSGRFGRCREYHVDPSMATLPVRVAYVQLYKT